MNSNGQLISFPVDALLDQSVNTSTATALPGTCAVLKNLEKVAEAGALTKRRGYRAVDNTSWSQNGAVRIFGLGDQVVSVDGSSVWSYTEAHGRMRHRDRAPRFRLVGRRHVAGDGVLAAKFGGCAVAGAYRCWVWQQRSPSTGTDEVWSLIRDGSGAVVRGPERLSTAGTGARLPRVLAVPGASNTRFYVHWLELSTSTIKVTFLAATAAAVQTGSWSATATAATDVAPEASEAPSFDVALTGTTGGQKYVLAYIYRALSVTGIRVYRFFSDGVVDAASYQVTAANADNVTICGAVDEANVWVATSNGSTTVTLRALDGSLALLASASVLAGATNRWSPLALGMQTSTRVCLAGSNYDNDGVTRWGIFTYAAGNISASGASQVLERTRVESKPFFDGGDFYAWIHTYSRAITFGLGGRKYYPHAATVLVRLTNDGLAAANALGQAQPNLVVAYGRTYWGQYEADNAGYNPSGAAYFGGYHAPQAVASNGAARIWGASVRPSGGVGTYDTAAIDEYEVAPTADATAPSYVAEQCGRTVICSGGGQPMQWDGQRFVELGHPEVPFITTQTPSTSGGLITAGTYQYAVTYEYADGTGQRHQSAPDIHPVTVATTGTTSSVSVQVACAHIQAKMDGEAPGGSLSIVLWRTKAGPDGIFRRVGTSPNALGARHVTIVDTVADSVLGSSEPLTGELENVCPPPSRHVVPFGGRIAGIDAEFPDRIWFGKRQAFGEGFSYSPALQQFVPGIGELTALAEAGGSLFAFSQTGIAVAAYGDGIDNTGGGSWPAPQVLTRGLGCVDARAIETCPDGVLFASGAGGRTRLWLLAPGVPAPVEIGAKVRRELDTYSTVTSMAHSAAHGRVYITVADGSENSEILVYDYGNRGADGQGVWYVWSSPLAIRSAAFIAGAHWTINPSANALLRQSSTSYADRTAFFGADAFVAYEWQSHDFRVGSFAPFGKLNKVTTSYEYAAPAAASIAFSLDQGITWTDPYVSTVASGTVGAPLSRQVEPAVKRIYGGIGYRIRLTDASSGQVDSASVLPRGITVDHLPLPGTVRPSSTERVP